MTLVYAERAMFNYETIYVKFERSLTKKPSTLNCYNDLIINISGLISPITSTSSNNYKYECYFTNNSTIRVDFTYDTTVRSREATIGFGYNF